eukprot:TRINITY_DN2445_c0_g1_i1.p1 TRINITY_DN2445_c0_g1~~TRINITY_DN2445_c0_g1_i1.p1  ORF type:complete len:1377 (+),score=354.69 TRINITY_DN2445_c0_g1_i1:85-4215(+)
MFARGDGAYELPLGVASHGRIWERRPQATGNGILLRALNSRRRANDPLPAVFQAVAFSGDGQTCAAADKHGHLYIFYLQLNRFSRVCSDGAGPSPAALCFTCRRHEEVLCGGANGAKNEVRVFDVDTHRETAVLRGHRHDVRAISASAQRGLVLTQSADATLLWDVQDWSKRRTLQARASPMVEARFNSSGDLCAVLFRDARISLWRADSLAFEAELVLPRASLRRSESSFRGRRPRSEERALTHFAASAKFVAASEAAGDIFVWSTTRPEEEGAPSWSTELERPAIALWLEELQWQGQGVADALYVLQDDGQLVVASLKTRAIALLLELPGRAITTMAVSSHSMTLLLAASDGSMEVREVKRAIDEYWRDLEKRVRLGAPREMLERKLGFSRSDGPDSFAALEPEQLLDSPRARKERPLAGLPRMAEDTEGAAWVADEADYEAVQTVAEATVDSGVLQDSFRMEVPTGLNSGSTIDEPATGNGRGGRRSMAQPQQGRRKVSRGQNRPQEWSSAEEDDAEADHRPSWWWDGGVLSGRNGVVARRNAAERTAELASHEGVENQGHRPQERTAKGRMFRESHLMDSDVAERWAHHATFSSPSSSSAAAAAAPAASGAAAVNTAVPSLAAAPASSGGSEEEGPEVAQAPRRSSVRDLQVLLRKRGSFPDDDRPHIWQKLLALPRNRKAFQDLERSGVHPRFQNIHERYPHHSKGTLQRLTSLLSQLAHWSPVWAEVPYLAPIAFPFLKVLGGDDLACFEMVASLLINWARPWVDELPGPPLCVLGRLDDLFIAADPVLHGHLRIASEAPAGAAASRGGSVHTTVLWPMLQTLLTEVLHKAQWLQLWDHLLAHWAEPEMLHAAIVAFLCTSRASLLELPARSPDALDNWLRQPHKVDMAAMGDRMHGLQAEAASLLPTPLATDSLLLGIGHVGGFDSGGNKLQLPLPKGPRYPLVATYPHLLSRHREELGERGRTAAHLTAHRDQLLEIRTAVEQLCQEELRFRQQQDELLQAEASRRQIATREEDRLLEERRDADERLLQKRLDQIKQLYAGVEESLKQQQVARAADAQQLLTDLKRRHRERTYEIEARLKEEAVMNLELRGTQCVSELLQKRRTEENRHELQSHIRTKRREMELQDELQQQQWRIEDEKERARLQALREQRLQMEQREADLRKRREVEMELRLEELERQLQMAQVARERVIRRAQQDAALVAEVSEDVQRKRHEVAARSERREQAMLIAEQRQLQRKRIEEREQFVEEETRRWRQEVQAEAEDLSAQAAEQVRRDYDVKIRQATAQDADLDVLEEQRLRRVLFNGRCEAKAAASPLAEQSAPSLDEREQRLEALIKKREAELEALWKEFDKEAQEFSEEEGSRPARAT